MSDIDRLLEVYEELKNIPISSPLKRLNSNLAVMYCREVPELYPKKRKIKIWP